jgi:nucleotide-binding universal stress UspA family protein
MFAAIRTILIADLVMSLDNVIGVAAAAKDSVLLLIIGLAISIPLVIFASTVLLTLMTRFPIIITIGAGLLGWVAGEMAITDPAVRAWVDANAAYLHYAAPALGAVGVVLFGNWMARRAQGRHTAEMQAELPAPPAVPAKGLRRIVLAVDGSEGSLHAVRQLLALRDDLREPRVIDLHLVNVQPSLPGDVSSAIGDKTREQYHHEQSDEAMKPARDLLDAAGLAYQVHRQVGDPATTVAALADTLGADLIVMGSRGLGGRTGALLGSVAQRTLELSRVPVLLSK